MPIRSAEVKFYREDYLNNEVSEKARAIANLWLAVEIKL